MTNDPMTNEMICTGGEIGRRTVFRSQRSQGCAGSNPVPGTNIKASYCKDEVKIYKRFLFAFFIKLYIRFIAHMPSFNRLFKIECSWNSYVFIHQFKSCL